MFISPSDTEEFINFQKSVLIMTFSLAAPPEEQSPSTPFPRIWDDNQSVSVDTGVSSVGKQYGRYQDLLDANPYRNLTYNQSGWQKMLSSLGFRTGYDDFREQAEINAREYDASIMSMIQQNEYNSPAEQASRMREAGLNPDLQGLGDVADAANPADDPNGMPAQQSQAEASALTTFAKGIYSCVMGGLSFAKDITAMKQMQGVIEGQNIANAKSMMSAVDDMIFGSISAYDVDSNDDVRFVGALNDLASNVPDFRSHGFSSRQIAQAEDMWRSRVYSLANDERLRKAAYERYKAMSDSNRVRSEGFYADDEQTSEVIGLMIDCLANTSRDFYKKKSSNDLAEQNVREGEITNRGIEQNIQEQYLDNLNDANFGAVQASADVEEQRAKRSMNAVQNIISENKEVLYTALKNAADNGNGKAQAVLYLMVVNDLAQFEIDGGIDLNFLKGIKALAGSVLSGATAEFTEKNSSGLLKNFGLGADVHLKVKNK